MRANRLFLLFVSSLIVLFLLGGGLVVKVGAAENSYRQAVLFAEVLSLVLENYVDPVEADGLLKGAYEGMLGGLDPNGAYLTPQEVAEWKAGRPEQPVDPGLSILKAGRSFQVVAVDPGSPAQDAGVEVGDQIRELAGRLTYNISLGQARRLLKGDPGTSVTIGLLHTGEGFQSEEVDLDRAPRRGPAYELDVKRGIAVLKLHDPARTALGTLRAELDDVRSRGIETLLLDLRNIADGSPRETIEIAGVLGTGTQLRLRDPSGRLLESLEPGQGLPAWDGRVAVLVNGATAGGSEALALLAQLTRSAVVYGETTYGLGAEPKLYELENGAGLLVSSAVWETVDGRRWNGDGVEPDQVVRGDGDDFESALADQLNRVLEKVEATEPAEAGRKAA
jgi:carboxyl-terminal processing protease